MRKWGVVVTTVYALVLAGLIVPIGLVLSDSRVLDGYKEGATWAYIAILVACQAILLFVSVDTSQRPRSRSSIVFSVVVTGILFSTLAVSAVLCLVVAIKPAHDTFLDRMLIPMLWTAGVGAWTIPFYLLWRNSNTMVARATSWLIKGSVLELLIAVPSHVIVRRRNDCSAPLATGFGICSGIAIMLLAFGPSVLLLYKKRIDEYASRKAAGK